MTRRKRSRKEQRAIHAKKKKRLDAFTVGEDYSTKTKKTRSKDFGDIF